jgi:hypothetical protein
LSFVAPTVAGAGTEITLQLAPFQDSISGSPAPSAVGVPPAAQQLVADVHEMPLSILPKVPWPPFNGGVDTIDQPRIEAADGDVTVAAAKASKASEAPPDTKPMA